MQVIKIGGNEMAGAPFRHGLARAVAALAEPAVLVHGGGLAIADLQQRLGLQPVKLDGVRVTDAASLEVAQMVLSGQANKAIVQVMLAAGVPAAGISGVDGGLLRCRKKPHPAIDLGFVGEVVSVAPRLLHLLLDNGMTPVVSPISLGETDFQIYNVNADEAAAAIAGALSARMLTFVSNVPGVLDAGRRVISRLSLPDAESMIEQGVIAGGMIPKVRAALAALAQGVPRARIVDLDGLDQGGGTTFGP